MGTDKVAWSAADASETPPSARTSPSGSTRLVREFRQILLWPLELMQRGEDAHGQDGSDRIGPPVELLGPCWSELVDEFPSDPSQFQERHYREFVSFLPHVQRLLYGGRAAKQAGRPEHGGAAIRVFRRHDIARVRVVLGRDETPLLLDVAHVDLNFFNDVDVVILAFEITARDLELELAQDIIYRFGRAYPAGWTETGAAAHCAERVEWLDADGQVLAASDFEHREKFLNSVCLDQVPAIAAHWEFMLSPMAVNSGRSRGALRSRLVEYYRLPSMAYLALDDPRCLTPGDFVRLGLALAPGDPSAKPYAARFLEDFEDRYCYDRFHDPERGGDWVDTRIMCCGHAFVVVGDARRRLFTDPERGVLAQFRHQFFLIGLMAHLHRAALLMLSDRFVRIIGRLDIERPETVSRFRTETRRTLAVFLRFTHRYWFSEVTDQVVARDLFRLWSGHLETERLYASVRDEIQDMSQYLDSDMLRRTSRTMVRLTVVAILSLVGTATTGFLGMNLIAEAEAPLVMKVFYFSLVTALATVLTLYTVFKARRLAEFLDALADERLSWRRKLRALGAVWKRR